MKNLEQSFERTHLDRFFQDSFILSQTNVDGLDVLEGRKKKNSMQERDEEVAFAKNERKTERSHFKTKTDSNPTLKNEAFRDETEQHWVFLRRTRS